MQESGILTMGVDVQNDRIAYEVISWGEGFESRGAELWGDPQRGEVWNQLGALLACS